MAILINRCVLWIDVWNCCMSSSWAHPCWILLLRLTISHKDSSFYSGSILTSHDLYFAVFFIPRAICCDTYPLSSPCCFLYHSRWRVIIVLSITASPVLPLITCLPVICTVTMATSFSDYVKDINLALYFVEQAPIIHQA